MRRWMIVFAASVFLCALSVGQEQQSARQELLSDPQPQPAPPPPSLGEIARQLKLKKQQKEAQLNQAKQAATPVAQASDSTPATPEKQLSEATPTAPPAKTPDLITNDDTPTRATVTAVSTRSANSEPADSQTGSDGHQANAETWKSQILQQKKAIAALQEDIKTTGDSIHYAGANCVANCAQWNEKQQQKQQEVDSMKTQLEDAQKQLEDMQEAARKQGFGSSVYDP